MEEVEVKCKDCPDCMKAINQKCEKYRICGLMHNYGVKIDLENRPEWCPRIGFDFGDK